MREVEGDGLACNEHESEPAIGEHAAALQHRKEVRDVERKLGRRFSQELVDRRVERRWASPRTRLTAGCPRPDQPPCCCAQRAPATPRPSSPAAPPGRGGWWCRYRARRSSSDTPTRRPGSGCPSARSCGRTAVRSRRRRSCGTGACRRTCSRVGRRGCPATATRGLHNAESLGGVALGVECVHPLDGVPGGEIIEEEADQPVGQSGLYCWALGVLHGGGSCLCITYIHALIRSNSKS